MGKHFFIIDGTNCAHQANYRKVTVYYSAGGTVTGVRSLLLTNIA